MKKLVMCVWNDFDKDDRVRKKAYSLSKKFKVVVKSVCKAPKPQHVRIISPTLLVEYYWVTKARKHSPRWFFYRLIANKEFWIDKVEPADVYDCNDPDTLVAGVIAKKRYGSKLVYDSHEYWARTMRKEATLYYTLYSYIGNFLQYIRELAYYKYADRIITVSKSIQEIYKNKYNKPTYLIYNYSNYNKDKVLPFSQRKNIVVFLGGKVRVGVSKHFKLFNELGFKVFVIGVNGSSKGVFYTGFLTKEEYRVIMRECILGFYAPENTCKNIYYSMPNKIFEYIQSGLPIVVNNMKDMSGFVSDNKLGYVFDKSISKYHLLSTINQDYIYDNLKKAKKKFSWESQEPNLFKIYKFN